MARFSYNDRVEYNGHQGRIKSIWLDMNGDRVATVEFDDQTLIPPEMEILESRLVEAPKNQGYYGGFYGATYGNRKTSYGPVDKVCPKCGTNWTVTKFNNNVWKDCKKCGKKMEDLI